MRSIKSLTLTSILIASSVATYANTTLLDEDWEGYSSLPATVTTPWQARFGGGTTPTPSTIRVVNTTIASVNSNWGFIDNSATDEPASNPGLLGTFTADSRLDISFSFMLPANYGNNSQLKFNLGYITPGGTTSTVLSLFLGPNYQGSTSMLAYQSSTSTRVNLGGSFVAGQQVNVFLTDINKATGTYNIAWTSSGGDNGSVSNITLTNAAATSEDWNFISFGEASNVISTSQLYVDNILVTAVPEPSTYAALAGLGAIGLAVLSRRRSRG